MCICLCMHAYGHTYVSTLLCFYKLQGLVYNYVTQVFMCLLFSVVYLVHTCLLVCICRNVYVSVNFSHLLVYCAYCVYHTSNVYVSMCIHPSLQGYRDCAMIPLFELGSVHHLRYLVNLRLRFIPLADHVHEYRGISQLGDMSIVVSLPSAVCTVTACCTYVHTQMHTTFSSYIHGIHLLMGYTCSAQLWQMIKVAHTIPPLPTNAHYTLCYCLFTPQLDSLYCVPVCGCL